MPVRAPPRGQVRVGCGALRTASRGQVALAYRSFRRRSAVEERGPVPSSLAHFMWLRMTDFRTCRSLLSFTPASNARRWEYVSPTICTQAGVGSGGWVLSAGEGVRGEGVRRGFAGGGVRLAGKKPDECA